jgi:glycosyltransferase involved in cell wall biosynthesis
MSKQRQKWLFFSALPPFRGGIAKFSLRTLESLAQLREVKAFTFKKQYPDFLFPGKTQYDELPQSNVFERTGSTFNPFSYFSSALRFRCEKPTVFVTSYWMTFMAPMMVLWTYFLPRKTKKIAIVHNLNPHEKRFFDRWFNRIFLGAYDGFVVLSASVQQEVLRLKPAAKIALIPHPPYETECAPISKEEARAQLGLDPHKKTLLFFGLIRPYKGLSELIAAFGLLDGNYQLLIAGEVYGSSATYESALTALPFENWKFDNRYIADSEVASYFAAADLVVLPYLSATQSGVRAMALSQQRAVLCTNVGGLAEGLEANQHGFELKSTRPEQFAERIQQLFNQGDITECNRQLSRLNLDLEQAWLSFAKGLIALAEDA